MPAIKIKIGAKTSSIEVATEDATLAVIRVAANATIAELKGKVWSFRHGATAVATAEEKTRTWSSIAQSVGEGADKGLVLEVAADTDGDHTAEGAVEPAVAGRDRPAATLVNDAVDPGASARAKNAEQKAKLADITKKIEAQAKLIDNLPAPKASDSSISLGARAEGSLVTLKPDEIVLLLTRYGLPRTFALAGKTPTLLTRTAHLTNGADKIRALSSSSLVMTDNRLEFAAFSDRMEWQNSARKSGVVSINASIVGAIGSKFGFGAEYSQKSQTMSGETESGETRFMTAEAYVRKFTIDIPKEWITLSPEATDDLVAACKIEGDDQALEALQKAFGDHGYGIFRRYHIGGRLYAQQRMTFKGAATQAETSFQNQFKLTVEGTEKEKAGEGSGGVGTGSGSSTSQTSKQQMDSITVHSEGGTEVKDLSVGPWVKSLTPDNWVIVGYDDMAPIYEFLGDANKATRDRARKLMSRFERESDDARVKRQLTYSLGEAGYAQATSNTPVVTDKNNRFSDTHHYVDTKWVEVPVGRYFRGISLFDMKRPDVNKIQNPLLGLQLTHSDGKLKDEQKTSSVTGELSTILTPGLDSDFWYFDTTPLRIPNGKRIIAARLNRGNPPNRVRLEIRVADLDGKTSSEEIFNQINNQTFIYLNTSGNIPTFNATLVPVGRTLATINLAGVPARAPGSTAIDHYVVGFELGTVSIDEQ